MDPILIVVCVGLVLSLADAHHRSAAALKAV